MVGLIIKCLSYWGAEVLGCPIDCPIQGTLQVNLFERPIQVKTSKFSGAHKTVLGSWSSDPSRAQSANGRTSSPSRLHGVIRLTGLTA